MLLYLREIKDIFENQGIEYIIYELEQVVCLYRQLVFGVLAQDTAALHTQNLDIKNWGGIIMVIETERLILRELTHEDFSALFEILSD